MRRLVLVAGSASLLDSAAIISVGSTLPLWRAEIPLTDAGVGAVSATMAITIAVGALLGGRTADRWGRLRVFTATVVLYAVGALLVAIADSTAELVVGIAVLGVGSGADLPASIALVAERVAPSVRGRMVASTHLMWTVGIVCASAAALVAAPYGLGGMRLVFLVLALAAVTTVVSRRRVLALLTAAEPPTANGAVEPERAPAGPRRILVTVAVFYVLYTLVANTFGTFRTYVLVVIGGATQQVATGITFGATLVGLAGTAAFTFIADSPRRRRVYPIAGLGLVSSQVVLALVVGQSLHLTVLALLLYALAYPYVGEGLYKVWAQEAASHSSRATYQGMTIAMARAAAAAFALVTPWLLERDPSALFWLLAVVAAIAVLIGRGVQPRQRVPSASGH